MATAPPCRECTRTNGAPMPHGDTCVFANVNSEFDFSMLCTQCLQCAHMEKWLEAYNSGNNDTPPAPRPHSKSCPLRPEFDFSMQCLECLRLERWNDDYCKGNVYCPGAPRVHNCGK